MSKTTKKSVFLLFFEQLSKWISKSKRILAPLFILILFLALLYTYIFGSINTYHQLARLFVHKTQETNSAQETYTPTVQSNIDVSECFAYAWLGYYYPYSTNSSINTHMPLHYTFTITTNWNVSKTMVAAKIENVTINTSLSDYTLYIYSSSHARYDDYPDGIPMADMYPDGLFMYRDELANLSSRNSIDIPINTSGTAQYFDEITPEYGYYDFRIKLADIGYINMNDLLLDNSYNTKSSALLSDAGLTKSDLNTQIDYDLIITFSDGTSETKHLHIDTDGNQLGDWSSERQNYTE